MKKINPKKTVSGTKTGINIPVNWAEPDYSFTNYTKLRRLKDGDWRIYRCDGDNFGYIVKSDMEEALKLLAQKLGYRLVKEPKEVK